jgi:hypothetical protein
MSKTTDAFRAINVINTHDLLTRFATKKDGYAVDYRRHDEGRVPGCNKTLVWSPFEKTDPKSHWMNRGNKAFTGNRADSRVEALAWICARTKTKPVDWVPSPIDPQNVLVHKDVRARAMAALKEHEKRG